MFDITQPVRNFNRWREVQAIFFRYGFDFLVDNQELRNVQEYINRTLKINLHLLPESELSKFSMPQRVRLLLQELGPTYIKLGQIISSRRDVLPKEWIKELSKLQDAVPPFPFEEVEKIIEKDLGHPIAELFLEFEQEPVAAASIGQVHRARLMNLNPVVVKIRRPKINTQVQSDLEIIGEIVRQIENRTSWGKRYGVISIFQEFARTLNLEMDFRNEATNAMRLRRLMRSEPRVQVPYVYWELTTEQIMTMEYIDGVKINDLESLDAAGINRKELADVFVQSIFKQLLVEGFFHADPHPGNLFVDLRTHTLVYIDLGMTGRLLPEQRQQLGDLVRSILRRDSRDVTRLIMMICTAFEKVDEAALRRSVDQIINRYLEISLDNISFSTLLTEVLGVIFNHGLRLPSELSMAIKTIIQGEEVAHTLDPNIVVVDVIRTVSQQIIWQMLSPSYIIDQISDTLRELMRLKTIIPKILELILKQIEGGTLSLSLEIPDLQNVVNSLSIISNRLVAGLIVAGMIIGSALILGIPSDNSLWSFVPVLGLITFLAGLVFGFTLVWGVVMDIWTAQRRKRKFEKLNKK